MKKHLRRMAERWAPALAFGQKSFSQEGEDLAILRMLGFRSHGFYVDIGSHHPFRFSNTYLLYRRGWSGICIDPLPGSASAFNKYRPRDIAVQAGVAEKETVLTYHMFDEPALNSFDKQLAETRHCNTPYNIVERRDIKTRRMDNILAENIPPGTSVDVLSVDVEGFDLSVLKSNDWEKYRPSIIIAECGDGPLSAIGSDPVAAFLDSKSYDFHAKTGLSVIFVDMSIKI
ncbi:MAG: FkbM family methyltransferase [Pacificimonas sp.]